MYCGRWSLLTAPTEEPVTLSEVKAHLHLPTATVAEQRDVAYTIPVSLYSAGDVTGLTVDVGGLEVLVQVATGSFDSGATLNGNLQHSDNGTDWEDVTDGDFDGWSDTDPSGVFEYAYGGTRRYLRAFCTVANGRAQFGVLVETIEPGATAEDDYLRGLVRLAREMVEDETWRSLCTQTWQLRLDDAFPADGEIVLPRPPCQSVTEIEYVDAAGADQVLAATEYELLSDEDPARVVRAYGVSWPGTRAHKNAVRVEYVAGYGGAGQVPQRLRQAVLLLVGHFYENREATAGGRELPAEIALGLDRLLGPYKTVAL